MGRAADTTDFTAIHSCLRRGGRALAEAVAEVDATDRRRIDALERYWRGYAGEVLAHHTVEDDIFYPALVERAPEAAEHLARIDADHHQLDELMAAGHATMADLVAGGPVAPCAGVLAELDHTMHTHLDYEDADLVPLFARHFDEAEYAGLGKAAVKSLGLGRQALFTVPFVGSWVDDDVRAHLLGNAPLPFRVMYRLTRRSHDRLAASALGAVRERVMRSAPEVVAG